jgi:hypothetical protein
MCWNMAQRAPRQELPWQLFVSTADPPIVWCIHVHTSIHAVLVAVALKGSSCVYCPPCLRHLYPCTLLEKEKGDCSSAIERLRLYMEWYIPYHSHRVLSMREQWTTSLTFILLWLYRSQSPSMQHCMCGVAHYNSTLVIGISKKLFWFGQTVIVSRSVHYIAFSDSFFIVTHTVYQGLII